MFREKLHKIWCSGSVAAIYIVLSVILFGCGADRKNFIARTYHNTTSLFNGYYNANIRYKDGVKQVEANMPVPQDEFIPLLAVLDPQKSGGSLSLFDEAINKCDLVLYKHKNSKWADNCRFLIGRSWFYKKNYSLAIQNFEYVLSAYPKSNLKPAVTLWLAKTYFLNGSIFRAREVLNQLTQDKLLKKNLLGELTLLQATLAIQQEDYPGAITAIENNIEIIKPKKMRARCYFLLAQLYDTQKSFPKAYENYQKVVSMNTENNITFQAKINIAKLFTNYQEGHDESASITKLLRQLSKDVKYEEFLDQIYYQWALVELKKKDEAKAIEYLNLSLRKNKDNVRQKALSYYQIGRIYFYNQRKFTDAQAYFDSAATIIKPEAKEYDEIKSLAATLKEYVKHLNNMVLQDSLLTLSALSPEQLEAKIDQIISAEEEKKRQEAAQKAQDEQDQLAKNFNTPPVDNQSATNRGSFYFDNVSMVAMGRQEFTRIWGNRNNEDNWRRKNKDIIIASTGDSTRDKAEDIPKDPVEARKVKREKMKTAVPKTPKEKTDAENKLIESMVALAQIYDQKLNQPDSAIALYNRIVTRFPDSDFAPKAYYGLYTLLLKKDPNKAEEYKQTIIKKFPGSMYAKLANKEIAGEEDANDTAFLAAYNALYDTYLQEQYSSVISFAGQIIAQHPTQKLIPNVYYLRGMSFGFLQQYDSLKTTFLFIKKNFPDAGIITQVNQTLALLNKGVAESGTQGENKTQNSASQNEGKTDNKTEHSDTATTNANDPRFAIFNAKKQANEIVLVIALIDKSIVTNDQLKIEISRFNSESFKNERLTTNVFLYHNQHHLVYISQFLDFKSADTYIRVLRNDPKIKQWLVKPEQDVMFITPSNFSQAYRNKKINDYQDFFLINYKEMLAE